METVPCTLCKSDMNELLESRTKHNRIKANTVICRNCGLVFLNPRMAMEEYTKFYSSPAYRKIASNTDRPTMVLDERSLRGAEEKLAFLKSHIDISGFKKKRFLDVGCSAGYLPFVFHSNGWEAEGIEPTKTFAEHGRKKFGLKIRTGLLETEKFADKYSFITLIHVFEHILEPHAALRKLRALLTDNGILYIEVPNIHEFYGRFEQSCDIAHPYFYSPATLAAVLKTGGFDVIEMIAGSSIRVFAKKGAQKKAIPNEYGKTINILQRQKRNYYLKGYFIFTPVFDHLTRFLSNHASAAKACKKFARAYSRSRLPFSNAVRQLGAVE